MDYDRARQIEGREPAPVTWAEELERGREIVAAVGDLPSDIAYEMIMRAPEGVVDALGDVRALRPVGAPPQPPNPRI